MSWRLGRPLFDSAGAPHPHAEPLPVWGAGAEAERALRSPAHVAAMQDSWRALWSSRVLVWLGGIGAVAVLGYGPARKVLQHAALTHGFGSLGDLLVAPAARWDAGWYLLIAHQGYEPGLGAATAARGAFFPLYPLLVRSLSVLADRTGSRRHRGLGARARGGALRPAPPGVARDGLGAMWRGWR